MLGGEHERRTRLSPATSADAHGRARPASLMWGCESTDCRLNRLGGRIEAVKPLGRLSMSKPVCMLECVSPTGAARSAFVASATDAYRALGLARDGGHADTHDRPGWGLHEVDFTYFWPP